MFAPETKAAKSGSEPEPGDEPVDEVDVLGPAAADIAPVDITIPDLKGKY